jgi:hypothetical protein
LPRAERAALGLRRFQSLLAAKQSAADTVQVVGRVAVKAFNIKGLSPEEVFFECLALLGVLVMTAVLAIAMRVGEGQW